MTTTATVATDDFSLDEIRDRLVEISREREELLALEAEREAQEPRLCFYDHHRMSFADLPIENRQGDAVSEFMVGNYVPEEAGGECDYCDGGSVPVVLDDDASGKTWHYNVRALGFERGEGS